MLGIRRFLLYSGLICLTVIMVGTGFQTAERGIQSLVGTGGPPKSIHVHTDDQAIQVTFLGKKVVQPTPTLGDRWSRRIEAAKGGLGDTLSSASYRIGMSLQRVATKIIEWIGAQTEKWMY